MDSSTTGLVEGIARQFAGGRSDDITDTKIRVRYSLLPDGTATMASSPGTEGSMGVLPAERE